MDLAPMMSGSRRAVEFEIAEGGGALIAHLTGDLTIANAATVRTAVYAAWAENKTDKVIVEMNATRRVDSSGVGALMELAQRARQARIRIALRGVQQEPRKILNRTGIGRLFEERQDNNFGGTRQ